MHPLRVGAVRVRHVDRDPFAEVETLGSWYGKIAESRRQANEIKRTEPITVVIGNPPYNGTSAVLRDAKAYRSLRALFPGALAKGQSLRELLDPLRSRYFLSGEINTKLPSQEAVPAKLEQIAAHYADGRQYKLDGLSVEYPDWHFNVRPSNTEPLLRLNLEATRPDLMAAKRDEVLALIRA